MSFTKLGLSPPLLQAVAEQGYETPTPIQLQAIPAIMQGMDVMAAAQTGTGKTAGFALPIWELLASGKPAQSNQVRALVLTPTRELAAQVAESFAVYGKHLSLRSSVVFGGVNISPQMIRLRKGADVLVATPGRLLDLYNQRAIRFNSLEVLVLDEADRMLDMGFIHDIRKILALLPKQRQTLMFSATFSDDIRTLAKGLVDNPIEISVGPRNTPVASVTQWLNPVDKSQKPALLTELIIHNKWRQVLVFTRTKHGANKLTCHLEAEGIKALAIHGNKSQGARTKALAEFKSNAIDVLVATDIAARGLDIDQLPQVVNFDLPHVPEDYVHRIGRTGRAGATGQAVSLVCGDEIKQLTDIERLIKQVIPRKMIDGFEPVHALPESGSKHRPVLGQEPKESKPGHRSAQWFDDRTRGPKFPDKNKKPTGPRGQASGNPAKRPNRNQETARSNRRPFQKSPGR
ncbi:MAG: DEAD/DEAH box helicase [Methylococcales bacterium]